MNMPKLRNKKIREHLNSNLPAIESFHFVC